MLDLVVCHWVLRVPHVVGDELLDLGLPRAFQVVIVYTLNFIHQALNVLDKDVVARYQDSFLLVCGLLRGGRAGLWRRVRVGGLLRGCL